MSTTLVAYFSPTGTTATAAKKLAQAAGADLFEIVPQQPYVSADLNWNNKASRSSLEMSDESCRPAIAHAVDNMDAYDTIFVGFPIWWYVEPRIIDTFLESYNFAGKTIVPFATSGGSGLGRAPKRMEKITTGANVRAGKTLNAMSASAINAWVQELGL